MVRKPSVLDSYCVVASLLSVGKTSNFMSAKEKDMIVNDLKANV